MLTKWKEQASHEWRFHIPDSLFALKELGEPMDDLYALHAEGQRFFEAGDFGRVWRQIARIRHGMRQKRGAMFVVNTKGDDAALLAQAEASEDADRPTTWDGLVREVEAWPKQEVTVEDPRAEPIPSDYESRTRAGWLGKIIGGALGGPVEGWTAEKIAETYGELTDYVKPPDTFNDDTTFCLTFISAMEQAKGDATSEELGLEWIQRIPVACTAEDMAIRNMREGILAPLSAWVNNPYAEWIGAQMRGDICGLVAPADPARAATLAWRDALISHVREGLYGEVFHAVLVSLAYTHRGSALDLIQKGLTYVPPKSLFARAVTETVEACESSRNWREAWDKIVPRWVEPYHWVHTLSNIPTVIIGLWFGWGDFGRSITLTTQCGLDTDSTAGQTGAIMGVLVGMDGIEARWADPIGDTMESWVVGMEKLPLDELVDRTCQLGRLRRG